MKKKILVTGGYGMVGNALRDLKTEHDLVFVSSADYDLRDRGQTRQMFLDICPEQVIHLAAKVGGIRANMENMGSMYADNANINVNVLEEAKFFQVEKVVSMLSTCVYPDSANYPLTEDQLHNGEPHSSNFGYAYAKRLLDVQSRAYRAQYGCNFICAIINNLFGENDQFNLINSHVIPALIHKMYLAKINNTTLELWSGKTIREFTYSKDAANIVMFLLDNYSGEESINVGNTNSFSIKEVADIIASALEFKNDIVWNNTYVGQLKKPSDNSKFVKIGWDLCKYTNFEFALRQVCSWFVENYPNIRGVGDKVEIYKCRRCGSLKNLSYFFKDKARVSGHSYICILCEKEKSKKYWINNKSVMIEKRKIYENANKEKISSRKRILTLRNKYNMTQQQYDDMIKNQEGKCLICGKLEKKLVVDHNHKTGKVRGLLCGRCNTGLGCFEDNEEFLFKAFDYLKK